VRTDFSTERLFPPSVPREPLMCKRVKVGPWARVQRERESSIPVSGNEKPFRMHRLLSSIAVVVGAALGLERVQDRHETVLVGRAR
jgi:hypothetical protein